MVVAKTHEIFLVWVVEESTVGFVIISDENHLHSLCTAKCVTFGRIIKVDVGDAEEGEEFSVVWFLAVGFTEWCGEGACVRFHWKIVA